jgi:hypothetical protein
MDIQGILNQIRLLWRDVAELKARRPAPLDTRPTPQRVPHRVASSSELSTNHFNYKVKRLKAGAATHSGLGVEDEEFDARNVEEEQSMGGYFSSSVTALNPIANGKIVWCWWSMRKEGDDLVPVLLFSRDNEPICEPL